MPKKTRNKTIRKIAIKAMQGLLANPENYKSDWNKIAEDAITYAKALYNQLEEEFPDAV